MNLKSPSSPKTQEVRGKNRQKQIEKRGRSAKLARRPPDQRGGGEGAVNRADRPAARGRAFACVPRMRTERGEGAARGAGRGAPRSRRRAPRGRRRKHGGCSYGFGAPHFLETLEGS